MDKELLYFFTVMILLFAYRLFLSIRLLSKKQNIIDEKFYVYFFTLSIASILCFIFKNIVIGIIIAIVSPFIVALYFAFNPKRTYWIINGYEISDATYNNEFIKYNQKYSDIPYLVSNIQFLHKKQEKKTKLIISIKDYKEKESLLNIVKEILFKNVKKSNKNEIFTLIITIFVILLMALGIVLVLFL